MGQYHYTVNLNKNQFIDPHKLGDGLKLVEQCGHAPGGTNDALHLLLAVSSGRGGGDFKTDSPLIGSWGGDRIAVVGDYGKDDDLKKKWNAGSIYHRCHAVDEDEGDDYPDLPRFECITNELRVLMSTEYEVIYFGDGWMRRVSIWKAFEGLESTYAGGPRGRVARFKGSADEYWVSDLLEEAGRRLTRERPVLSTIEAAPLPGRP